MTRAVFVRSNVGDSRIIRPERDAGHLLILPRNVVVGVLIGALAVPVAVMFRDR